MRQNGAKINITTPALSGGRPAGQRLPGIGDFLNRCVIPVYPSVRRQPGEQHQIQRVLLAVGGAAEIVAEQECGLAQRDRDAQLHHHPLIGRHAVDDRE